MHHYEPLADLFENFSCFVQPLLSVTDSRTLSGCPHLVSSISSSYGSPRRPDAPLRWSGIKSSLLYRGLVALMTFVQINIPLQKNFNHGFCRSREGRQESAKGLLRTTGRSAPDENQVAFGWTTAHNRPTSLTRLRETENNKKPYMRDAIVAARPRDFHPAIVDAVEHLVVAIDTPHVAIVVGVNLLQEARDCFPAVVGSCGHFREMSEFCLLLGLQSGMSLELSRQRKQSPSCECHTTSPRMNVGAVQIH